MTDKQIEILYKSIPDLKDFSNQIKKAGNIWLSDDLELIIGETTVEIILETNKIQLNKNEFGRIINELFKQQEIDKENKSREEKRKLAEKRKYELTLIADNTYRVEKEYLEEMFYARQVSVGYNSYKNQLRKIIKILNNSGTILIEDKRINNKTELEKDLQWRIGLESLEHDLRG